MTDYGALLRELAIPRLVGSAGHARVREVLARELARRGFAVTEQRFSTSHAALVTAGRGALVLAGLGTFGALAALGGSPHLVPLAVAICAALSLFAATPPLRQVLGAGARAAAAVNLIATRPSARPALWLVAHYDSKGQPISMATRLYGAVLAVVAVVALGALTVTQIAGVPPSPRAWIPACVLALLAGGVLAANARLRESPGAVDNGAGILAVLGVVDRLPPTAPIGVIFPDAEEFGMLGARALVGEQAQLFRDTTVINFDGIDDRGGAIAFVHRPGSVVDAVVAALGARRFRALPVFVDGLILARAARECVTILKGNWETVRIVHTKRDTADRLTLMGVEEVARGVAAVLREAGGRRRET